MDPNAALERLRRLAVEIIQANERPDTRNGLLESFSLAMDMAELFQGLDEWITVKKGLLPQDWKGE